MRLYEKCDVLVAGGGTAGAVAAIAAARTGADTVLLEQYGHLGGILSLGMSFKGVNDGCGRPALGGIGAELLERVARLGGATEVSAHPRHGSIMGHDSELMKLVLMEMIREAGVRVLLHTFASDVLVKGGVLQAAVVANKAGLGVVPATCFVDATGDADLAARSGADFVLGREADQAMQPASSIFRVGGVDLDLTWQYLREHPEDFETKNVEMIDEFRKTPGVGVAGFWSLIRKAREAGDYSIPRNDFGFNPLPNRSDVTINLTRVHDCDGTDPESLSRATMEAQGQIVEGIKFLRKYVPGFASCFLVSNPYQLGIRETRRVLGDYVLTEDDVRNGKDFEDQVARGAYPLDIHEADTKTKPVKGTAGGETDLSMVRRSYGIPQRCLRSRNIGNLAMAGRALSATHLAAGSARGQPVCLATGHAAGTMAALCATRGLPSLQALDPALVRRTLLAQGAVLDLQ